MTDKTIVVNIRDGLYRDNAVFIDRRTKYGNPFRIGRDGTREEVIAKFRKKTYSNPEFIAMVRRELTGKILKCWCKPLPCHGDIYVEICDGTIDKEKA